MDYIGFPFFSKPHLVSKHATLGLVLSPRWSGSHQYPILQPDVLQVLGGGREGPLPRSRCQAFSNGRGPNFCVQGAQCTACSHSCADRNADAGQAKGRIPRVGREHGPGPAPPAPAPPPGPACWTLDHSLRGRPLAVPAARGGTRGSAVYSPPPPGFAGPEPSPPFGS